MHRNTNIHQINHNTPPETTTLNRTSPPSTEHHHTLSHTISHRRIPSGSTTYTTAYHTIYRLNLVTCIHTRNLRRTKLVRSKLPPRGGLDFLAARVPVTSELDITMLWCIVVCASVVVRGEVECSHVWWSVNILNGWDCVVLCGTA